MFTAVTFAALPLLLIVLPLLLGASFCVMFGRGVCAACETFVYGFLIMLALMQVLFLPFMALKLSFSALCFTWISILSAFAAIGLIWQIKHKAIFFKKKELKLRKINLIDIALIALILMQVFGLFLFGHRDDDDASYVASALTDLKTDSIYKYDPYTGNLSVFYFRYNLSCMPLFTAALSLLSGMHPAVMAHTVLPAVLIPLAYAVYYMLGRRLFINKPDAVKLFLLFACFLNIFGNTSPYTTSSFLLLRIWQGKALLAAVIIPILIWLFLEISNAKNAKPFWAAMFLSVVCACGATSMGIALAPLCLLCFSITDAVMHKKIKHILGYIACGAPALFFAVLALCADGFA